MSEPIRVLQVMSTLDRGGAETVVMDWLRRIDREQVAFNFAVNDDNAEHAYEQEARELGCRILRVPRFRLWNSLPYAIWWYRCLKSHDEWQIIHAHHTSPAFVYLSAARLLGRVTVAHSHTAGQDGQFRSLVKRILRRPLSRIAQVHLACSKSGGDWMFGRSADSHVIHNGVDLARFNYSSERRLVTRKSLGLTRNLVVGHVGSFSHVKNHQRILRIFTAVLQLEPTARLLLVGDGPLREGIEAEIASLGIADSVVLTGVREDVPDLLAAMDVFLLPSHFEGLPVVVVEAQASGLPCVVSDAVTDEVALTDLVNFVSLDEPNIGWADALMAAAKTGPRRSRVQELRAAGYDSAQVAQEMQEMYLRLSAPPTRYQYPNRYPRSASPHPDPLHAGRDRSLRRKGRRNA